MSSLSHDIMVSGELIYDLRGAITTLTKRVADLDREVLFLRGQVSALRGYPADPSEQLRNAVAEAREQRPWWDGSRAGGKKSRMTEW